jgi:transcriptional regulator with XRE-family HTH domain
MAFSLGKRIRDLRRARGLTAAQLAERLGVSEFAVSRWECGHTAPRMRRIAALAKALGVSLPELWSLQTRKDRRK